MLVAAAVCPHPPLLFPELAGEAATELDGLRDACAVAVGGLREAGPEAVLVVGGATRAGAYGPHAAGSLAPWGADVLVGTGQPVLPLSLTAGRWLLDREGMAATAFHAVPFDASEEECARLGARLAEEHDRVALLVMADGSARLTEKSPGYLDPRALPYDAEIVEALGRGEVPELDRGQAEELWVQGRAALRVLAGAGGRLDGRVLYADAPYGVGYFVAALASRASTVP
ncbi:class III extradiol dioxygenase subunit B-like domain-containing protein [Streptosporangium sp. NPDC020072]|uniref:class III extradiol dioxygenase subunit B-like domain-containing protein n=1 Tax=Streptosporangium sp. NPDC020072 TaxID=3154788 RepID=UPI003442CB0E